MDTPRLPKTIENTPAAAHLAEEFARRAVPLWSGGEPWVPRAALDRELRAALESAAAQGRIVRGLESAGRALAAEARGLGLVDQKTGAARGKRASRLLVMTDDGADRFYRSVESLLRQHAPRVLGLRLTTDERHFGQQLFGPDQVARLVLVEHKDAMAGVLLALAASWQSGDRPLGEPEASDSKS